MATPKEIRGRISSVSNTRKITRTMELVSTAKSKKAVDKVVASRPYADKIGDLIVSLASQADVSDHALLRKHPHVRKALVVVVTSNRGLCGGYNTNVLKESVLHIEKLKANGSEVVVHLIGKKALNYFNYQKIPYEASFTHIDDKVSFADAQKFADAYMQRFADETVDQIDIIFTKYFSAGVQKPVVSQLLPVSLSDATEKVASSDHHFLFEPTPAEILSSLLPKALRVKFYQGLLDAVASEQIARRLAMKNATEAASDMIKELTLKYNKVRQAKITQEIAEIVSGAEAIS